MRTTPEECREIARIVARKLNAATGPTVLYVPLGGVSMIATEGQAFHDPEADEALFSTLREELDTSKVEVHELELDVNDPEFALAMANRLHELLLDSEVPSDRSHACGRRPALPAGRPGQACSCTPRRRGFVGDHGFPHVGAARGAGVTRAEALARLRAQIDAGSPVIGAGAGTGLSAKLAEAGGADLIIIYNSGRYRMAGRGSLSGLLPYGDANAIVVDMSREVLPIVEETPVLAGVCGTDPFRLMDVFLDELRRLGFSGVQNFPTVGLFDGTIRQGLEETGMGYGLEVEMIRLAREKDFLTAPYVFTVDEAVAMAEAGADVLVPHMGLTTGGTIGAESAKTLDDCVPLDPGDARRREGGQSGPDRPLPRRADRRAGRRRLRDRQHDRASSGSSAPPRWSACRPRSR